LSDDPPPQQASCIGGPANRFNLPGVGGLEADRKLAGRCQVDDMRGAVDGQVQHCNDPAVDVQFLERVGDGQFAHHGCDGEQHHDHGDSGHEILAAFRVIRSRVHCSSFHGSPEA